MGKPYNCHCPCGSELSLYDCCYNYLSGPYYEFTTKNDPDVDFAVDGYLFDENLLSQLHGSNSYPSVRHIANRNTEDPRPSYYGHRPVYTLYVKEAIQEVCNSFFDSPFYNVSNRTRSELPEVVFQNYGNSNVPIIPVLDYSNFGCALITKATTEDLEGFDTLIWSYAYDVSGELAVVNLQPKDPNYIPYPTSGTKTLSSVTSDTINLTTTWKLDDPAREWDGLGRIHYQQVGLISCPIEEISSSGASRASNNGDVRYFRPSRNHKHLNGSVRYFKRWTNKEAHNIYYLVSSVTSTNSPGKSTVNVEIRQQHEPYTDFLDIWRSMPDTSGATIFSNDGIGCCCGNFIKQYSSGVFSLPERLGCSGCTDMYISYESNSSPYSPFYTVRTTQAHNTEPNLQILFFETEEELDSHISSLDLINLRDTISSNVPILSTNNSISRAELRELSTTPEDTCFDGSSPINSQFDRHQITSRTSFEWDGVEYTIEPSGSRACNPKRIHSLGRSYLDPEILSGSNDSDYLLNPTRYTFSDYRSHIGRRSVFSGDYWISGVIAYSGGSVTEFDAYENPTHYTNKGVIYITSYPSYQGWRLDNAGECRRLNETKGFIGADNTTIYDIAIPWFEHLIMESGRFVQTAINPDGSLRPSDYPFLFDVDNDYFLSELADASGYLNLSEVSSFYHKVPEDKLGSYSFNETPFRCLDLSTDEESGVFNYYAVSLGYRDFSVLTSSDDNVCNYPKGWRYYYGSVDTCTITDSFARASAHRCSDQRRDPNETLANCLCDEVCDSVFGFSPSTYSYDKSAYQFDLTPQNVLLISSFFRSNRDSLYYLSPIVLQQQEDICPNELTILNITELLIQIGAEPMGLWDLNTGWQDPDNDDDYGNYHYLPNQPTLENDRLTSDYYIHMYDSHLCSNTYGVDILYFEGELLDVEPGRGISYFVASSMKARNPCNGQLEEVGNPCDPYWYCGRGDSFFACSDGSDCGSYTALAKVMDPEDIGETFVFTGSTASPINIVCKSFLDCGGGWEFDSITSANYTDDC